MDWQHTLTSIIVWAVCYIEESKYNFTVMRWFSNCSIASVCYVYHLYPLPVSCNVIMSFRVQLALHSLASMGEGSLWAIVNDYISLETVGCSNDSYCPWPLVLMSMCFIRRRSLATQEGHCVCVCVRACGFEMLLSVVFHAWLMKEKLLILLLHWAP